MLPQARVIHLHKNLPQAPEDHPDFWAIWRGVIRDAHPAPLDFVFGSDAYLFRLAEKLGAAPVLVDPDREIFPVSGSAIRKDAAAHWSMISGPVRPHFQRRLMLLAPESVGKTRLAADLARHFSTMRMPEYGRAYDVHYKQGRNWRADDLVALAATHRAMRDAMRRDAGPLLIEDTDAIQTAVWSRHLVGDIAPALAEIEAATIADHYLVLAPDVAWVGDGVRYAGDEATRAFFFEEAKRRLRHYGAAFDVISGGDWASRRALAIRLAEKKFGTPLQSSR